MDVDRSQSLDAALGELARRRVIARLWRHDHTVWKSEPTEIDNRLGWLTAPASARSDLGNIARFGDAVRREGFNRTVLLGMGGSSLAPETWSRTFGTALGYSDLDVLDSTHPSAVERVASSLDPDSTLFLVSTKSGTTTETLSFFRFFHRWAEGALGRRNVGRHFAAITDPGSPLVDLAEEHTFRALFLNDPNIGGRYAALSLFGLVPGGLLGLDLDDILNQALAMSGRCAINSPVTDNPGAVLGAFLAACAAEGKDKVTFVASRSIEPFCDWVEQLIAESLGKEGKGIVPVVHEPLGEPDVYDRDRLFVQLRLRGDSSHDDAMAAIERAGHPSLRMEVDRPADLGGQFFLWEFATAVAGALLHVNPFDQPDVESAKRLARETLVQGRSGKKLPSSPTAVRDVDEALADVSAAEPGDYVGIQAYLAPSSELTEQLTALRVAIRNRTRRATTVGYGPRFLHSTGQLHKGDGGHGIFLQLVDEPTRALNIPASGDMPDIPFALLLRSQAAGDAQALVARGRRIRTLNLGRNALEGVRGLSGTFAERDR